MNFRFFSIIIKYYIKIEFYLNLKKGINIQYTFENNGTGNKLR